jgi:predicted  nucleic acid-binding Zn-ribbon protein
MEILKKIENLKKSVDETNIMLDKLISSLEAQKKRAESKEKKIIELKQEIKSNVDKIDEIIESYNVNS